MSSYIVEEEETWRRARELAWEIYSITGRDYFGDDNRLKNAIRRASFAIMANVAEGFERGGTAEFNRYLLAAKEDIADLGQQLQIARARGYIGKDSQERIESMLSDLGCMISGLMTYLRQSFMGLETNGDWVWKT